MKFFLPPPIMTVLKKFIFAFFFFFCLMNIEFPRLPTQAYEADLH